MTMFESILELPTECGWFNGECPEQVTHMAVDAFDRTWGFCDKHRQVVHWGIIRNGDVDTSAVDVADEPQATDTPKDFPRGSIYY